jgi:ubiquitin C-terminal hydrolase
MTTRSNIGGISTTFCGSGSRSLEDIRYVNCVLSCVVQTPPFMEVLEKLCTTNSPIINYLRALSTHSSACRNHDEANAPPPALANLLTYEIQEDASECLARLLNYIEAEFQREAVDDFFAGSCNTRVACLQCACYLQKSGGKFTHLSLSVPTAGIAHVSNTVAAFTAMKALTSDHWWECVTCKEKVQVSLNAVCL